MMVEGGSGVERDGGRGVEREIGGVGMEGGEWGGGRGGDG